MKTSNTFFLYPTEPKYSSSQKKKKKYHQVYKGFKDFYLEIYGISKRFNSRKQGEQRLLYTVVQAGYCTRVTR